MIRMFDAYCNDNDDDFKYLHVFSRIENYEK